MPIWGQSGGPTGEMGWSRHEPEEPMLGLAETVGFLKMFGSARKLRLYLLPE
jgi:hypothetical protein